MLFCSILVGIIGGLGAVVFRAGIAFFHNAFFERKLSLSYNANIFTPTGAWGHWIILAPVIGALGVAFLVTRFAPEAKGHGVPEVIEAVSFKKGIMRPAVVWTKALASALGIGTGGSIGREGPIIQIGAAMGSWIGQKARLVPWETMVLISCGAGAGIAATFNTPIGGVLFAIEIILHEISVKTLVPVVISTATASYVGRLILGPMPSFMIPAFQQPYFHPTNPWALVAYCGLGALLGVLSTFFIQCIYSFEDFFEKKLPGGYFAHHMLGMLGVGIVIDLMMTFTGHYYVEGVGYSTVQATLSAALTGAPFLLLLAALKLLTTSLTLGSGGSGGIFSPSLFIGATFGAAYGELIGRLEYLNHVFASIGVNASAFAVAGMAGMVGGATGAAVTAIVMVFEMTRDYNVVIPMTLTVAIAYAVRTMLCRQSIYTEKLARRGEAAPDAFYTNSLLIRRAADFMEPAAPVRSRDTIAEFVAGLGTARLPPYLISLDEGKIVGVVTSSQVSAILRAGNENAVASGKIAQRNFTVVEPDSSVLEAIQKMHKRHASFAVVVEAPQAKEKRPIGVISNERIGDKFIEESELLAG